MYVKAVRRVSSQKRSRLNHVSSVPPTPMSNEAKADQLLELSKDVSQLNSSQVEQLVSQLEGLLDGPNVSLALGNTTVHIVSNLLGASPDTVASSSDRYARCANRRYANRG